MTEQTTSRAPMTEAQRAANRDEYPALTPALMRSLRTFASNPTRMVPQGSPVFHQLHDLGLIKIVGTRYGRGAGRHNYLLWESVITDAGRAALATA